MFGNLSNDLRYTVRSLRKNPAYSLVAIITLALGIGATTSVFSVVNSVLLRPLPFKSADELVQVWSRRTDNNKAPFTVPDFLDYRDQNQTLLSIAAYRNVALNFSGAERTERLPGLRVSANLFQLLGVEASVGRLMLPRDDTPDQRHVVVLTHDCWQRRFAGDAQIVGKSLNLNGESFEVIGIMPRDVALPIPEAELAIPLAPDVDPLRNARSSVNSLHAVARLKPGVTRAQAESDLTSIVTRQRQQYGEAYLKKIGVNVVPLFEELIGNLRTGLLALLGAVVLVLLIACSNLAALSLTRASGRSREIAIKKALGATSTRVAAQLLAESLLLAVLGGSAGLLLAIWGVRALLSLSPTSFPRAQEIGVDVRALAFAVGVSVFCAVIFGILPALQSARAEVNKTLKANGRGVGDGARQNRWRSVLVVTEVSLSFVLLIGAGLLIQSFKRVQAVQPGFDPADTLAVRVSLPRARYDNRAAVSVFVGKLLPALQTLPGVEEVGAVSLLPMGAGVSRVPFSVAGQATSASDTHTSQFRLVTPGYFRVLKVPLLQGRWFTDHDNAETSPVALVNETLGRRLFPSGNAVGAQIKIDDNNTGPRTVEIAGVVGNVKQLGLESEPTMDVYLPLAQIHEDSVGLVTNSSYWVVRSKATPRALEKAFIGELQKVDRDVATSDIKTLDDYLSESVGPRKFSLRILTVFSVAALLLAVTGIYGVVSYIVAQRTPEIGIRLALGAKPSQVFQLVLGQGVKVILVGVVLGSLAAFALSRVIRSLLFGVTPSDPATFVFVSVLLIVVALIACSIPARRATKVDPLIALRTE
ncbi:MAG TPA: ABC transporter permease [Pyrinomonadaceae bacterium]|nr:ABC transporter permease [Pyrinomonadaceae bacterium]